MARQFPLAVVLPGQGSQFVGMGYSLAQAFPEARRIFEEADRILGYALSRLMWEGPEAQLNQTEHTQPAIFVHAVAAWTVLQERLGAWRPHWVAGHSLGELTALVLAGALDFANGLRLVQERARLMAQAGRQNPGRMAAILGLPIEKVEAVVQRVSERVGLVQVANDNCPGQVVISGTPPGVTHAVEEARQQGARRSVLLKVSVAAHSLLMAPAQDAFNRVLSRIGLRDPHIPVVGNVAARPLVRAEGLFADLSAQLTGRVRWRESVEYMIDRGTRAFLEVGPGNVLVNLIKRIRRDTQRFVFGEADDLERVASALESLSPSVSSEQVSV
ncbi:MAG: ACP S-malonyltransferase [Chloroflexi bacterium]|nr:ACP S-malonyltransferase [Chloroflexota bacterium]